MNAGRTAPSPLALSRALGMGAPRLRSLGAPAARSPGFEAAAIGLSVVGSVTSLVLYARGETKLAAAIGATGLIVGGAIAIAQVFSGDEDVVVEP